MGDFNDPTKFDETAQRRFLVNFAATGRMHDSARCAGVTARTVNYHIKAHPAFAEAVEAARGEYCDHLEREIYRRAVEGWEEPVFRSSKDGPELVGFVRRFSDRMLELLAKRAIPAYRDRAEVDVNVGGGVLVVPGLNPNWEEKYHGSKEQPGAASERSLERG